MLEDRELVGMLQQTENSSRALLWAVKGLAGRSRELDCDCAGVTKKKLVNELESFQGCLEELWAFLSKTNGFLVDEVDLNEGRVHSGNLGPIESM